MKLLAFILIICLSGCEVLKTKQSKAVDSTAVHRIDSGSLRIESNQHKDSNNWYREIIEFIANKPSGDTTIIMSPNITTPVRIIREGGNQVITDKSESNDMAWRSSLDSVNYRIAELSKTKETKVMTQWWAWAIIGLVGLAALKILLPFKISMK